MKGPSYFIDTNVFLRTLLRDDEKTFRDCVNFLGMVKKKQVRAYTSTLILAELNWILLKFYKVPKEKALQSLYSVLTLNNLKFADDFNQNLGIKIYEKHPIKFIDALIASNPEIQNKEMIVISFDKDFDKLGIIRQEPKEAI